METHKFSGFKKIIQNSNAILKYQQLLVYVFCLLISALFLLIATKSSPLYPFNDWVDVNASFTMGKAMMNGKVLYRDIFDHRGPLLYFINGLAYSLSNTSFLGLFVFEVISFSIFLYFSFRTFNIFLVKAISLMALPLLAVTILNSTGFMHGGSPEELCIPLVAISLFSLIYYCKNIYPESMPNKWIFLNGIIAGSVLWIKYSFLGFWFGWIVSILTITLVKHGFLQTLKNALIFLLGMLIPTIPWLIYFGINHAIYDWIYAYFIINLIGYSKATSFLSFICNTFRGILLHLVQNPLLSIVQYFGLFVLLIYKKFLDSFWHRLGLLLCYIFLSLSVFGGGQLYYYYFLIFSPFLILGLIVILQLLDKKIEKCKSNKLVILFILTSVVAGFVYTLKFNQNTEMLNENKDNLYQYKFASMINKTENATLLNYGRLDLGVYTTTGIVPNLKYSYNLNIPYDRFPILLDEQNRYIKDQLVDYIVTQVSSVDDDSLGIPNLYENYTIIGKEYQKNESNFYYYLLFKKK